MIFNTLFSYLKIKCMMNITYPSLNAVSLCVTREKHTLCKEKWKKKRIIFSLLSPRENVLYTGSLVCMDGLIYEHFPESIHHDSIRLHVYFIPSFNSQWPVHGQWGCRLLIKGSNCWSCIPRMSKELEMVLVKFYSC